MLLTFMYHRILNKAFPQAADHFRRHLDYLCHHFPIVAPGELLPKHKLAVCLTFDDAYFDFYSFVFPLLKEYKTKAVLAVPTALIPEQIELTNEQRLSLIHDQPEQTSYENRQALCSWEELEEMAESPHVIMASHSFSHCDLTRPSVDLKLELQQSKYMLNTKLKKDILTFVYPYGKMNAAVHSHVKEIYPYIMRIGGALNFNWHNFNNTIYRINADLFWPKEEVWSVGKQSKYFGKLIINALRNK